MKLLARSSARRREAGFALLIVLLALSLLGIITGRLLGAARTEIAVTGNLRAAAMAGAAAAGGVAEAIIHLEAPANDPRGEHWAAGGPPHKARIGASAVVIRITSIDGKINPNSAPAPLLDALMRMVGTPPAEAQYIAGQIIAWRSPAATLAAARALDAAYRQAGRIGGPDGTSFLTIDALGAVLGMNATLLARLRPHLSLYAPALPVAALADPVVRAALRLAGQVSLPGIPMMTAPAAEVEAVACGPGGACVTRCDVVSLSAGNLDQPYRILAASDAACAAL